MAVAIMGLRVPDAEIVSPFGASSPRGAGLVLLIGAPPAAAAIIANLRIEGFRVVRAADAQTARRQLRVLRPDVVVLDVELKEGGGWALLQDSGRMAGGAHLDDVLVKVCSNQKD